MSNHNDDLLDLDPTEDDLASADLFEDDEPTAQDDLDLDFDSNYRDDRYESDGIPAWSAWA